MNQVTNMEIKKPPLGLVPRKIQDSLNRERRARDILEAMTRYVDHRKWIPLDWIVELNELWGEGENDNTIMGTTTSGPDDDTGDVVDD